MKSVTPQKERSLPLPGSEEEDRASQSEGNHEVEKEANEVESSNPSNPSTARLYNISSSFTPMFNHAC